MCTNGDPLERLTQALAALRALEPGQLGDGDAIVALHRHLEQLEAVTTRAVGAFERGRAWEADGARTASAWLAAECSLPLRTARRRVVVGRALRDLPVAERAWLDGEVNGPAVGLLANARTEATAEALARDEALLVDHAGRLSHGSFAKALAYWRQRADPDGVEDEAEALHDGTAGAPVVQLRGALGPRRGARPRRRRDRGHRPPAHRGGAVPPRLGRGPVRARRGHHQGAPGPHPPAAPGRRPGGAGPPGRGGTRGRQGTPSRCSPCTSTTRPSPGASASWPGARW